MSSQLVIFHHGAAVESSITDVAFEIAILLVHVIFVVSKIFLSFETGIAKITIIDLCLIAMNGFKMSFQVVFCLPLVFALLAWKYCRFDRMTSLGMVIQTCLVEVSFVTLIALVFGFTLQNWFNVVLVFKVNAFDANVDAKHVILQLGFVCKQMSAHWTSLPWLIRFRFILLLFVSRLHMCFNLILAVENVVAEVAVKYDLSFTCFTVTVNLDYFHWFHDLAYLEETMLSQIIQGSREQI